MGFANKKISLIYHQKYGIPLPPNHRFMSSKFSDLFEEIKRNHLMDRAILLKPKPVAEMDLVIAHDPIYIKKIKTGCLSKDEERRLGLNWSPELAERSFLAVNGTLITAIEAMSRGIACHLAGGTHHSYYDFGSGFCVFNDLAFTALRLLKMNYLKKIMILDCDVHQGDGTAKILENEPAVFTCSIHCKKNFPARKAHSNLDIELPNGIGDEHYMSTLNHTLKICLDNFTPDLVIYDAGVDVAAVDELGYLDLTTNGIFERDKKVLDFFKSRSIPVATVIGGGYSKDPKELAQRHCQIFKAAYEVHQHSG